MPASVDPAHGETCYSVDSPLLHGAAAAATPTGRHGATTHPAAPPGESAFHFEHCAYCLTHAGSFALLAADATAALAVLPRQVPPPAAANQLPGGNLPWLIAHSRAPPILR